MMITKVKKWGVDIGNVLLKNLDMDLQRALELNQISISEVVNKLEEVPGGLKGLKYLVDLVGPDQVWIISKASILQERVSRLAFQSKFPIETLTGFKLENLRFCLERSEKAPILKELGIQGHIDDRGEVIYSIQEIVDFPFWFNPEVWDYEAWRNKITHKAALVQNWQEILTLLNR